MEESPHTIQALESFLVFFFDGAIGYFNFRFHTDPAAVIGSSSDRGWESTVSDPLSITGTSSGRRLQLHRSSFLLSKHHMAPYIV